MIKKNTAVLRGRQTSVVINIVNYILDNMDKIPEFNGEVPEENAKNIKKYIFSNIFNEMINNIDLFLHGNNDNVIYKASKYVINEMINKNVMYEISIKYYKYSKDSNYSSTLINNIINDSKINLIVQEDKFYDVIFDKCKNNDYSIFYINECYNPPGIGLVISGINRGNDICINDELYLGPINKELIKFKVKLIHNDNREQLDRLTDHGRGCIAMGLAKKGMLNENK